MNTETLSKSKTATVIDAKTFLANWQGHRRLTRRVIEAFPEDKLFNFSVGGMRPFAELASEMLNMGVPTLKGAVTRKWEQFEEGEDAVKNPSTKAEILEQWDKTTEKIDELFNQISEERFAEVDLAFGQWEGPIHWIISYSVDNEIHHRGQGYVYLRALGIEPPPFWDRG